MRTYEVTYRFLLETGYEGTNTSFVNTKAKTDGGIARACAKVLADDAERWHMTAIKVIDIDEWDGRLR